jgi:hypothetical protein
MIPVDHSAPMLAAPSIAEVVIPFLTEGKLASFAPPQKYLQRVREKSIAISKARERVHVLDLLLRIERRRFLRGIRKRL